MVFGGRFSWNFSEYPRKMEHICKIVYFCMVWTRLCESPKTSRNAVMDLDTISATQSRQLFIVQFFRIFPLNSAIMDRNINDVCEATSCQLRGHSKCKCYWFFKNYFSFTKGYFLAKEMGVLNPIIINLLWTFLKPLAYERHQCCIIVK